MTNDKKDSSLLGRLRNSCAGFAREERGSVVIQVIFFSLMVFGMTGIVLDSGRVYDTHNGMQMFADRIALVAANELDRKSDSIERATLAVYGDGSGGLLAASDVNAGGYVVEALQFYTDMEVSSLPQNNMSEAFPRDNFLAFATASESDATADDAENAAYVVAVVSADVGAATRFMTQTIVNLGFSNPDNRAGSADLSEQIGPDSYGLQAVAAATLDRVSCANLSSLVMCNPWEDQDAADNPLLEPEELPSGQPNPNYTVPGRSLFFFAPNFQNAQIPSDRVITNGEEHGSLFPWDVNHQLFQVTDPIADASGVCSGTFLRDLAGAIITSDADSEEYIQARDRCIMAQGNAQQMCWSDEDPLKIKPADGDTVLRAVNTAFDIWLPPFEDILRDTRPVNPASGVAFRPASFFEPDRLAITTYERVDRFSLPDPTLPAECQGDLVFDSDGNQLFDADGNPLIDLKDERLVQDGIPDYNQPWPCDHPNTPLDESASENATIDIFQPAYDTVPGPGMTYVAGTRGEGMGYDFCHDKTLGRQDLARQDLSQCLSDAQALPDPVDQSAEEALCLARYDDATDVDQCYASATAGREREECGCEIDFVGDHHAGGVGLYMFARTNAYRNNTYDFRGEDPNSVIPVSPFGGPLTWNDFYQLQRNAQVVQHTLGGVTDWLSTNGDRSRVVLWNGEEPSASDPDIPANLVDRYVMPEPGEETTLDTAAGSTVEFSREPYLKHFPDDFLDLTGNAGLSRDLDSIVDVATLDGALAQGNRARRRIQAAMVNCGVVTGEEPDSEGNFRSANDDGSYDVTLDDMKVFNSYIPNPAGMFCGEGDVACEISDSVETSMYIELIDEQPTTDNYTARLVR
ncbi:MAG: hypothetical protein AAF293_03085 [Pseudomonadota bacterium]